MDQGDVIPVTTTRLADPHAGVVELLVRLVLSVRVADLLLQVALLAL